MACRLIQILGLLMGCALASPAADDAAVYEAHCVACHGADGRARTPQGRKLKTKDLRVSRLSASEIERQIREGSRNKTGVSVMPAFGKQMTDEEIQAAVRVVLAFRADAPAQSKP